MADMHIRKKGAKVNQILILGYKVSKLGQRVQMKKRGVCVCRLMTFWFLLCKSSMPRGTSEPLVKLICIN